MILCQVDTQIGNQVKREEQGDMSQKELNWSHAVKSQEYPID